MDTSVIKAFFLATFTKALDLFFPLTDFANYMYAIMLLATFNIILGWIADKEFSFKKACKAGIFLGGYLALLMMIISTCLLMDVDDADTKEYTSWVTWVMIYFYSVNILKNWKKDQPENKVIAFLYWVLTVQFVNNIKYLKEYFNKEKFVEIDEKS